jgi:hypothetical protein
MAKRKILALALCLSVSALCVTGAFAQVTMSAGMALSAVKDFAIDGETGEGEGVRTTMQAENGWGGNLLIDYLLPIGIPLSLGFELGVNSSVFRVTKYETVEIPGYSGPQGWVEETTEETVTKWEDSILAIPLLARVAYHFDLLPKLDLYIVGKIGYVLGFWSGDYKKWEESYDSKIDPVGGLGFGFDAGAAYYFSPRFGVFAEVGFDRYMLKTRVSGKTEAGWSPVEGGSTEWFDENVWDYTIDAPFNRIVTFGLNTKL